MDIGATLEMIIREQIFKKVSEEVSTENFGIWQRHEENNDTLKFLKQNGVINDDFISNLVLHLCYPHRSEQGGERSQTPGILKNDIIYLNDKAKDTSIEQQIYVSASLRDTVEKATEMYLEHAYFFYGHFSAFDKLVNKPLLNAMLKKGIIDTQTIEAGLEKGVLNYARSQVKFMEKVNADPTHAMYPIYAGDNFYNEPEMIAYAVGKGALSEKEKSSLRLKDNCPINIFLIEHQIPDYISLLRDNLLNTEPKISLQAQKGIDFMIQM
jgi:hypothetical protein